MPSLRRFGKVVILIAVFILAVGSLPVLADTADDLSLSLEEDSPVPAETPSMLGQLVRLVVSLSLIVGLALVLIRVFAKRAVRLPAAGWMNVVDQVALAPNKGLYLTEIAGKYYVLGVTDHQITKIAEIDNPEVLTGLRSSGPAGPVLPDWSWWKRLWPGTREAHPGQPPEFHKVMEEQLKRTRELRFPGTGEKRLEDYE